MNNLIECANVRVDCVRKNIESSKYSSEDYYGFNFNVKIEELNKMGEFIYSTLEKYNVPFINLYISKIENLPVNSSDSKESIEKSIKDNASIIIEEADKYNEYIRSLRNSYTRR